MGNCCAADGPPAGTEALGHRVGGEGARDRDARLRAITERLDRGTGGISGTQAEALGNERRRTETIGRCEELYRAVGDVSPVGLRSLSLSQATKLEDKLRAKLRGSRR